MASQKPVEWVPMDPALSAFLSEAIADTPPSLPGILCVCVSNVSVMKGRDIIDVLRTAGKSFNTPAANEMTMRPIAHRQLNNGWDWSSLPAVITNSFHGVVSRCCFTVLLVLPIASRSQRHDERILSLAGIGKRSISSKQELLRSFPRPK